MSEKNYLEELKNLKALPVELVRRKVPKRDEKFQMSEVRVPMPEDDGRKAEDGGQNSEDGGLRPEAGKTNQQSSIINHKSWEDEMDSLKGSKTMWGFGIAMFIYVLQNILTAFNIADPDNLILKTFIEVVIAVSGFFGVYGVRDALRKMGGF